MRLPRLIVCTLLALVPTLGHAAADSTSSTATERSAYEYIMRNQQPNHVYRLNLGSPEQYAFVVAMLAHSGGKKDPNLLAAVERAHASAPNAAPAMLEETAAGRVPLNLIEYLSSNGTEATTALLSSEPGGTSSTTMMVSLFAAGDSNPFASSPQYQELNAGKHFVKTYRSRIPRGSSEKSITASALFLVMVGSKITPYSMMVTAGPGTPSQQCLTAPNFGRHQSGSIACPKPGSSCVNGGKNKKDITVCLRPKGGNCNYNLGPDATTFPFTISGQVTFRSPIDPALIGGYILDLQGGDGGCTVTGPNVGGGLTAENFSIDPKQPKVLRYCFPNDRLPASSCFTAGAKLMLSLTVYAQVKTSGGGTAMATAVVSADPDVTSAAPLIVSRIPKISVTR